MQLEEATVAPGIFGPRVVLEEACYPALYIRFTTSSDAVRLLRFECTAYDYQAVDVGPVDPETREPLGRDQWMRSNGGEFPGHQMYDNQPFLCVQGVRRFYTHPSHNPSATNEPWEKHRPDIRIADLVALIAKRFASGQWT